WTDPMKVLDVAGGHGLFGIAFAKQNPNAEVTLLDWAAVAAVGTENARKAGVEKRFKVLAGSAFDVDYGTGYDVILLTNFLHHFDPATIDKLLKKVHAALKPAGRVVTLEFIPNEDRVTPPIAAAFPMLMLCGTPSGDAYTVSEFQKMFRAAGFSNNIFIPLPDSPQQLLISQK
ncbi:MAG: methyltransferase, partial [Elusimicrobia bacterium]|nr:methyltransferase [Elusimicrobiota bacterium]